MNNKSQNLEQTQHHVGHIGHDDARWKAFPWTGTHGKGVVKMAEKLEGRRNPVCRHNVMRFG